MVKNIAPHKRMCGAFGYGGFEVPKYNTFIEDKNGERIDFILDVAKRSRLNMGMRDGTLTVRVPYGCSKQHTAKKGKVLPLLLEFLLSIFHKWQVNI